MKKLKDIYTFEYFIEKFEAIPENEIGTGALAFHCSLHHVGVDNGNGAYKFSNESKAFIELLARPNKSLMEMAQEVWEINDNVRIGGTAKSRILDALKAQREKALVFCREND